MEIPEIKSKLTLVMLLHYYGLKADKQNRLKCPFHDDKTPSLQLYYKTQTCFCFSSNCSTHGKAIDVIDFILYYEKCSKHEAIKKAIEIIGVDAPISNNTTPVQPTKPIQNRETFLANMFTYFRNAVHNSPPAKEYLQSRCIDFKHTEVGYNAGQFHHGARKDVALIKECLEYGILLDLGMKARTGDTAYKPFGKWCIVFAMRNKANEIVSLYFRSILNDKEQRHFYMKDRQGLYPTYPKQETKKLILTESILDAATLLQQGSIKINYEILSLYGTNGFTEEHQKSIKALKELEEIIFFLNGDEAGNKAVSKYAPMLKAEYPNLKITSVSVPQNADVNSLLQGHSPEILTHLIDTRKEVNFLFSSEEVAQRTEKTTLSVENKKVEEVQEPKEEPTIGLNTNNLAKRYHEHQNHILLDASNPYNLKYQGNEASYQIKGFRIDQLDSLKITLQISI